MTHAVLYRKNQSIGAVLHVHCPEIWRNTKSLDLPFTSEQVSYGSVEMVAAIKQLFAQKRLLDTGIFSMLGHEDGIVAFGDTLAQATIALIEQFSKSIAIEFDERNR